MNRRRCFAVVCGMAALAAAAVWWYLFDLGLDGVDSIPSLHGKTTKAVLARLGSPDYEDEFTLGEVLGIEFYVLLFNTYPPDDPKTKDVRIKEWRWRHWNQTETAVLLHEVGGEWVVLDTCRWKSWIVF